MSLERKRGEWTSATMPQEGRRGALILIDSELAVGEVATAMMQYRWKALGSGVQQWRELVEDSGKSDEHGNWYRKVYTLVVHLVLYTLVVYIGSTVNEERRGRCQDTPSSGVCVILREEDLPSHHELNLLSNNSWQCITRRTHRRQFASGAKKRATTHAAAVPYLQVAFVTVQNIMRTLGTND